MIFRKTNDNEKTTTMKTKLKSILAVALCAVGLAAFAEPQTIDGSGVT